MSWDFSMFIDAGGEKPMRLDGLEANYTYNVHPMFARAFGGDGIRQLNNRTGAECITSLEQAIAAMEVEPAIYKAMNPPNGWGDYDSALNLLRELLRWSRLAPRARMVVS